MVRENKFQFNATFAHRPTWHGIDPSKVCQITSLGSMRVSVGDGVQIMAEVAGQMTAEHMDVRLQGIPDRNRPDSTRVCNTMLWRR